MRNVARSVAGAFTFLLVLSSGALRAQQVSGAITGYVTDPGGGAVTGAQVTVTDVLTGVATKTTADASGHYFTPNLIPGKYSVGVVASGFRAFVRENVVLNVD